MQIGRDRISRKGFTNPDIGLAFIYYNYKKMLSQTIEFFVATIGRQLAEQRWTISDKVQNLYDKYPASQRRPKLDEYLQLLQSKFLTWYQSSAQPHVSEKEGTVLGVLSR